MIERCTQLIVMRMVGYAPCMNRRSVHVKLGQLSERQIKRRPVMMVRTFMICRQFKMIINMVI